MKHYWSERNLIVIQILGGIMATLITITAYAYTTFLTKEEHNSSLHQIEKKLDYIEVKLDGINDYLRNKGDKHGR